MATFRKRNNKWQARIQLNSGPTQARTFLRLTEAKRWARQLETAYQHGLFSTQPESITLNKAFQRYLKDVNVHKKRPKIEGYRIQAWMNSTLSEQFLEHIKTYHLASWRDEKIRQGFQPNTIRLHLAVLSHLYTIAKSDWGYEELINPVTNLSRPKLPKGRDSRLSDENIDSLIANTNSSVLPCMIKLALYSGMRRSELIKLRWSDIYFKERYIHLRDTKNGEERFIPMTEKIKNLLEELKIIDNTVFHISEHAVTVAFSRAVKRSGLTNISFHTLRHEAITRFFEMGLTIPEVASISGHKSWSMLRRYTHMRYKEVAKKIK
jgi:integrase